VPALIDNRRFARNLLENEELLPALNEINVVIVLLDKGLVARFINEAFLKLWNVPEDFFSGLPDFAEIMRGVSQAVISPNVGAGFRVWASMMPLR
jgi:hypothetical protein